MRSALTQPSCTPRSLQTSTALLFDLSLFGKSMPTMEVVSLPMISAPGATSRRC